MLTSEFLPAAKKTLQYIVEAIEEQDLTCLLDLDFDGDIITISSPDGIFVINKHSAAKQIWLSSPISGPYHFSLNQHGAWQAADGQKLATILADELNVKFTAEL